jgi:hypothetical protein
VTRYRRFGIWELPPGSKAIRRQVRRRLPETVGEKQAAYNKFVREQCPVALEMTRHVVEQYGELKAWLFNTCGPKKKKSKAKRAEELINPSTGKELGIDENDIWIAAQAKTTTSCW